MVNLSNSSLQLGLYEVCGLLFDYIIFYALNNKRKFYLSDIIFFFITFPILFIFEDYGMPLSLLATILEILAFWLFYKKEFDSLQILSTSLLTNFLSLAIDSIMQELETYKLFSFSFFDASFYLFIILTLAWGLYHFSFSKFLTKINSFSLIILILVSFISLLLVENFSKSTVLIFLFLQLIFLIFLFRYYQKKETAQQLQKENKNLDIYLQTLKIEQNKLRVFKHDYQDLLKSLNHYANLNDLKSILSQLEIYSNKQISTNQLNISELNNISNPYLKSLIIEKYNQIYKAKISYSFECLVPIKIPNSINIFDLLRIIGIGYNNAVEESMELQKNNLKPEIKAMIYQVNPNELEFTIRNKTSSYSSSNKIEASGFTTKKNHTGLGLANVVQIKQKYDNLSFHHSIKNGWFTFTITIFND